MSLNGKFIFVTGGTGGIGVPLVDQLKSQGAIVTVYKRQESGALEENLETVCQHLRDIPPDILINLAGVNQFDYAENQDYAKLISVNLVTPMLLSQAVLPAMKARGFGHIVTTGSMSALIPLPHVTGYVAAKAGLKAFSDALRRELAGSGICVTHIVPRAVNTHMNDGSAGEVNRQTGVYSDDPEKIANSIVQAIRQQRHEVRFGYSERFFAFLNANLPTVVDAGLKKYRTAGESILQKL